MIQVVTYTVQETVYSPEFTLVLCLRKESIGRQSAVLLVMEMIGEGTLVAICGSIR